MCSGLFCSGMVPPMAGTADAGSIPYLLPEVPADLEALVASAVAALAAQADLPTITAAAGLAVPPVAAASRVAAVAAVLVEDSPAVAAVALVAAAAVGLEEVPSVAAVSPAAAAVVALAADANINCMKKALPIGWEALFCIKIAYFP